MNTPRVAASQPQNHTSVPQQQHPAKPCSEMGAKGHQSPGNVLSPARSSPQPPHPMGPPPPTHSPHTWSHSPELSQPGPISQPHSLQGAVSPRPPPQGCVTALGVALTHCPTSPRVRRRIAAPQQQGPGGWRPHLQLLPGALAARGDAAWGGVCFLGQRQQRTMDVGLWGCSVLWECSPLAKQPHALLA